MCQITSSMLNITITNQNQIKAVGDSLETSLSVLWCASILFPFKLDSTRLAKSLVKNNKQTHIRQNKQNVQIKTTTNERLFTRFESHKNKKTDNHPEQHPNNRDNREKKVTMKFQKILSNFHTMI